MIELMGKRERGEDAVDATNLSLFLTLSLELGQTSLGFSENMSSAHRPTWAPAQGKEGRQNSKVYSSRDLSAHTKLKFRQPGQHSQSEVQRRDLKLELLQAERESDLRKKKGERGLVVDKGLLLLEEKERGNREQEEANKRRKLLQQVADLDKDDEDDDQQDDNDDEEEEGEKDSKDNNEQDDSDDDDDDDEDDDEDETAELLRELEKIKRERAEEKERQVSFSMRFL